MRVKKMKRHSGVRVVGGSWASTLAMSDRRGLRDFCRESSATRIRRLYAEIHRMTHGSMMAQSASPPEQNPRMRVAEEWYTASEAVMRPVMPRVRTRGTRGPRGTQETRRINIPKNFLAQFAATLLLFLPLIASAQTAAPLPDRFVRNDGSWQSSVQFRLRHAAGAIDVTPGGLLLHVASERGGHTLGWSVRGGDIRSESKGVRGVDAGGQVGIVSREGYRQLESFDEVSIRQYLPGVELRVMTDEVGDPKYEFRLDPGVDPESIVIDYEGADDLCVGTDGRLRIETSVGPLYEAPPIAWQQSPAGMIPVPARFVVNRDRSVRFALGEVDPALPLVIDPAIRFSTYLGGNGNDVGRGVVSDAVGNVYVTGSSFSWDFPITPGAWDRTRDTIGGTRDIFVSRFDRTGRYLIWSTWISGDGEDDPIAGIRIGGDGNLLIGGVTTSSDFPATTGVLAPARPGGVDGFLLNLDTNGRRMVWSTYVGGSGDDSVVSFDVDIEKNIVLAGHSNSIDLRFPLGSWRGTGSGGLDMMAVRISRDGTSILNGSWFGGGGDDRASDIVVGPGGESYICGTTTSTDFPTTSNAVAQTPLGGIDGVVVGFRFDFTALDWATRIGGGREDLPEAIARDTAGNVLITGTTRSFDYPDNVNIADTGSWFATLFRSSDRSIEYSLILSADTLSGGLFAAFDIAGRPVLAGYTSSRFFPTTANPKRRGPGGGDDVALVRLASNGQTLDRAAVIGGSLNDRPAKHLWPTIGNYILVTGETRSPDFPLSRYPWDRLRNAEPDVSATDAFLLDWSFDERPNLVGPSLFPVDTLRCQTSVLDTFYVHNDGERPATISANLLRQSDGPFSLIEPKDLVDITLEAGDSLRYIVEYRNGGVGTASNEVLVYSTDSLGGRSPMTIPIVGVRTAPSVIGLPASLEFGNVPTCRDSILQLRLLNNGTGRITVRAPLLLGGTGAFRIAPGTTFPLTLQQGESREIGVIFDPAANVPYNDVARFTINECSFSILEVPLRGRGELVGTEGIPDSIDFGLLQPCVSFVDTAISIRNVGTVNVLLDREGEDPTDFTVISDLPIAIPPGESRQVTVRFRPLASGIRTGTIRFRSGECDTLYTVELRGEQGNANLPIVDRTSIDYGTLLACPGGIPISDSILRVRNPGEDVVFLSPPEITGPFVLCGLGTPPVSIDPEETVQFHICFQPGGEGTFDGEFAVEYRSGDCRDTIRIPLHGVLEKPQLQALEPEIDLGLVEACGTATTEVEIPFENISGTLVTIEEILPDPHLDLSGLTLPLSFAPGEIGSLTLPVNLKQSGPFSIPVRIRTGPCDEVITVTVSGTASGVIVVADRDSMRIGPTLACSPANLVHDTVRISWSGSTIDPVSIRSIRLRDGSGAISLENGSPVPGVEIQEGEDLPIGILYSADDIGIDVDTLELVLEPCGDTILVPISASAVFPTLSVSSGAFGQVVTGSSVTRTIAIGNNSGVTLELDVARFVSPPYSIDTSGLNLPVLLEPNEVILIPVTFSPVVSGQATDSIGISLAGGCVYRRTIRFDGEGINPVTPAELCIRGLYLEPGRSGDTAEISVQSSPSITLAAPVDLELFIRFDPVRADVVDVVDGDIVEVDYANGLAVISAFGVIRIPEDLPRIRVRLLAGEDLFTLVGLDSVAVIGGTSFRPTLCDTSAVVTIANNCIISGITLGQFAGKIEPISPNPAGDRISLTFQQLEDAPTLMRILDAGGREVLRPIDGPMQGGRYRVEIDLSGLSAGIYVVSIQSGSWSGAELFVKGD